MTDMASTAWLSDPHDQSPDRHWDGTKWTGDCEEHVPVAPVVPAGRQWWHVWWVEAGLSALSLAVGLGIGAWLA
jgi:Protein of unknown function (DUF2510)